MRLPSSIYWFYFLRYSPARAGLPVVVNCCRFRISVILRSNCRRWSSTRRSAAKNSRKKIVGIELGQIPYLRPGCCSVFLVLVLINGWFKNYHLKRSARGRVGRAGMLRRLRYRSVSSAPACAFPMRHFRPQPRTGGDHRDWTAELEPVGGFIGGRFALPIAQAGTLLTIFIFMFRCKNPLARRRRGGRALPGGRAYFHPEDAAPYPPASGGCGCAKVRKLVSEPHRPNRSRRSVEIRTQGRRPASAGPTISPWPPGRFYDNRFDHLQNRKFPLVQIPQQFAQPDDARFFFFS